MSLDLEVYARGLKDELEGHKAAGREDRAAEVLAELKRLGNPKAERAVKDEPTETATK